MIEITGDISKTSTNHSHNQPNTNQEIIMTAAAKTLTTVTLVHAQLEGSAAATDTKRAWQRHSLLLAPANADLAADIPVIEADTFEALPEIGSTVRVVIEDRKRIVGGNVYENRVVTRFIPA